MSNGKKELAKSTVTSSGDGDVVEWMEEDIVPLSGAGVLNLVQLNFRVPGELRRRVRLLAARDDRSLVEVLSIAIKLYEDEFGRVQDRTGAR